MDANNLIPRIGFFQKSLKLGLRTLFRPKSYQHEHIQLPQSALLMGWSRSRLGHDGVIDQQWCVLCGALETRDESFEDSDYVTVGPVVCALADEEGGHVAQRLGLEEVVLHEADSALYGLDQCLALSEHVGGGVLDDKSEIRESLQSRICGACQRLSSTRATENFEYDQTIDQLTFANAMDTWPLPPPTSTTVPWRSSHRNLSLSSLV